MPRIEFMQRMISIIVISAFAFYFLLCLLLFVFQERFIYFPTEPVNHSFTELKIESDGHQINVISLNPGNESAVLYFGGNAESVAYTADSFAHELSSSSVYLVNYRGYGSSSGKPSEKALYADALNIFDNLSKKYRNISVVGRSLGSGVASFVAAERSVQKLILITPFDSIKNLAQKKFPYFPMTLLLNNKFDSLGRAHKIRSEVLILVAENDKVIDAEHTNRLVERFEKTNKNVIFIGGSDHNSISEYPQYYDSIRQFIE